MSVCSVSFRKHATWQGAGVKRPQHKAANEIVAKARMVVVESLDFRDMMNRSGRRLAGGIARAAMSALQYKIQYRCKAAKVEFVKAPADFPSTRKCSRCGEPQDMPLSKRVYECLRCGPGHGPRRQRRPQLAALWRNAEPVRRVVAACCSRAA